MLSLSCCTDGKEAYQVSLEKLDNKWRSRARTGCHSIENILRERHPCWPRHVIWMDRQCIPQQALYCEVLGFKRGPGQTRTNCRGTVKKNMETWTRLGRGRGSGHQRRRMASECDPVYLHGCGFKVKMKVEVKVLLQLKLFVRTNWCVCSGWTNEACMVPAS